MKVKNLLATAVIAGAIGAAAIVPAIAQDATESEDNTTVEEVHAQREGAFSAALAEELGLEQTQVEEALANVHEELEEQFRAEHRASLEERLVAAVTAGDLTQNQADAILAAYDAGVMPFGVRGPGGHHGPRPAFGL